MSSLVNEIENGELNGPDLYNLVDKFLENFKRMQSIPLFWDVLTLYVKPIIQKIMGSGISIIETGEAVARQLKSKLNEFYLNENLSASNDLIKNYFDRQQ